MSLTTIAASVILILLGIRYLRKGLDRLFGSRLVDWLQGMTASRWKGFAAGAVAGVFAPSSTSIALLSVQMLNKAAVPAGQMLAVVLGANVGITITVQLLSFHLESSAAALLVIGGVAFLYSKRPLFRGGGQVLVAFGLIFLAMQLIGSSARAMAASGDVAALFRILQDAPWALLMATAVLTVLMQSSTASIALGIGLAEGGLLTHQALIPWVLGTNAGIAATSLIAGWGSVEGRRLGVGSLLLKVLGAAVTMGLFQTVSALGAASTRLPVSRLAADLHTGFNLGLGLVALLFIGAFSRLMNFLVEAPPGDAAEPESYLDPLLLQSPSLALNQAAREEFRMMDELKNMLRTVYAYTEHRKPAKAEEIEAYRVRLDAIGERLRRYLAQIGDDNLSPADTRWKFLLLDYIQELTAVAILIQRDFTDAVLRQLQGNAPMPAEEAQDVAALVKHTLERMERATAILMNLDAQQAEAFVVEKEKVSHWCRNSQRVHLERKATQAEPGPGATPVYMDLLNCLRRINSHLTSAAYAIVRPHAAKLEGSSNPGGL
jgi:phosphate:Na+ symporter